MPFEPTRKNKVIAVDKREDSIVYQSAIAYVSKKAMLHAKAAPKPYKQ